MFYISLVNTMPYQCELLFFLKPMHNPPDFVSASSSDYLPAFGNYVKWKLLSGPKINRPGASRGCLTDTFVIT